jgi:hypothetical protein
VANAGNLSIALDGIGHVLKDNKLRVPVYQRSYSWHSDNVDELLNDLKDAFNNAEKEYFLGSCVLTGSQGDFLDVVDGQQRLSTVLIAIAAVRDYLRLNGDSSGADAIQQEFVAKLSRRSGEQEAKLQLNEIDNQFFYEHVIESKPIAACSTSPNKTSHQRIREAKLIADRFVFDLANNAGRNPVETLHNWLDFIEFRAKIIVVRAIDDSDAFVIFEALNDRGLDLAISDLIKNYLFQKAGDKLDEVRSRWLLMNGALEGVSDDSLLVPFLRQLCSSRYGLVREKELFSIIKKKINTKKGAIEFVSGLNKAAKQYAALVNTDHEYWTGYKPETKEAAATLNLLGVTQIRTVFLAAMENFDSKEIDKLAPKLVSVAVRFQVVGGSGAGTLERIYADVARKISDKKAVTAQDVIRSVTNVPTDIAFEQAFNNFSISRTSLARYYLRQLEIYASRDNLGQLEPSTNTNRVNLEHVLPQSPSAAWGQVVSIEQAKTYYKRIGNLALLSSKLNSEIGNESFNSKKGVLAASSFVLTKRISENDSWGIPQIEARQADLSRLAVKCWTLT